MMFVLQCCKIDFQFDKIRLGSSLQCQKSALVSFFCISLLIFQIRTWKKKKLTSACCCSTEEKTLNFASGVGDCGLTCNLCCRSSARPSPPPPPPPRRPMRSRQRAKPRPPQVGYTNRGVVTLGLFCTCYAWHPLCVFLTALTRVACCCEETTRRPQSGVSVEHFHRCR